MTVGSDTNGGARRTSITTKVKLALGHVISDNLQRRLILHEEDFGIILGCNVEDVIVEIDCKIAADGDDSFQ